MDIRHMQYFLEVARHRSFTKAAETLYITQPTISKTIRNMEDEWGVTLFYRQGKKVELTDAGRIMYQQAQQMVEAFQQMSYELEDLMELRRGHLVIGLPPMIGSSFFPVVIGQFHQKYPQITIQLIEDGAKKVEMDVESGLIDIGVAVLPVREELFHYYSFIEENLKLLLHPSHSFAARDSVSLKELAEEPFVLFREDFTLHDRIIRECVQAGFEPKVVYESSQWDLISGMVAANLGIALLPETICQEIDASRVAIVPLDHPSIPWQLGMIWRKDRYMSFAAREWISFTRNLLAEKPESV
ncbi:cidABC operon transcriptional activator CidR [Paenibacillus lemnae]|uniref:LysR family transcriptional regulator n=1 Tax=Paenibacillus lemnae TaxID=1330551 RepID=A0A848M2H7_PAELE|nr:LysR family transcriptional regulator [Paenibacillus lemnae]NMO94469.1 LysR family transcriptional regulator [Paenibacillus lemnae]